MLTRVGALGWVLATGLGLASATTALSQPAETGQADRTPNQELVGHNLPSGYLGITFTCKLKSQWVAGGLALTHYGYPAVASVEPDSPAERAGIQAGDTILAYDAQDVKNRAIMLNTLLRPNSRLAVRLRRNGQVRNVTVLVAARPTTFVDLADATVAPMPPVADAPPVLGTSLGTSMPAVARLAEPASPPRAGVTAWWSRRLLGPSFVADDNDLAAIAGAEVVRTTPDLRDALGVSNGLLVVAVGAGTPAEKSSLRAGDVIISAGGALVATPIQLARAIDRGVASGRSIALQVERQHKTRRVDMKW